MADFQWQGSLRQYPIPKISRRKSTSDIIDEGHAKTKKSPSRKLSVVEEDSPDNRCKRSRQEAKNGAVEAGRKITRASRLSIPEQTVELRVKTTCEAKREPRKNLSHAIKLKRLHIPKGLTSKEVIVSPVPLPPNVICIDAVEDNGMFEYWADYISYLKNNEKRWTYSSSQIVGNDSELVANRALLMNWVLELALYFKVSQEALYHCVRLIDGTLAKRKVIADHLQLLAIASFFIACKLEEYYPPSVEDLLQITENSYTKDELYKMEKRVLKLFQGIVYAPEPNTFLNRYIKASFKENNEMFGHCCHLIVDLFIPSIHYSGETSSKKAAVAVFSSRILFPDKNDSSGWTPTLVYYSGYSEEDLLPLVKTLLIKLLKVMKAAEAHPKKTNMNGFIRKFNSRSRHKSILKQMVEKRHDIQLIVEKYFSTIET